MTHPTELKIYGIKNCDTMKKAFKWLDEQQIPYTFVDYKKAGVASAKLPEWCKAVPLEQLANTRGLMWRKIPAERKENLSDEQLIELLAEFPSAIKRPLLEVADQGQVLTGFNPEAWAAYFAH